MTEFTKNTAVETTPWGSGSSVVSDSAVDVYGVLRSGAAGEGAVTLYDGAASVCTVDSSIPSTLFSNPLRLSGLKVLNAGNGNYVVLFVSRGDRYASSAAGKTRSLREYGGLTFYADFSTLQTGTATAAQLAAAFSVGSGAATFTSAMDATHPATYVDDNGMIQLVTTADVGRIQGGYYDATGFHAQKGLMIETGGANLLQDSYFADGTTTYWRVFGGTGEAITQSTDYSNPYGGGQINKLVATSSGEGMITAATKKPSFTSGTKYTVSALIRGTGIITLYSQCTVAQQYGTQITLKNDGWYLYQYTFTADGTGTGNVGIALNANNSVTCYIAFIQCEAYPYATSFIPTTTASLSRAAETLGYLTSGNRTAATESIFIKFAPESAFASDAIARRILNDNGDLRLITKNGASNFPTVYANVNGTPGCSVGLNTIPQANTSYLLALIANGPTATPNLYGYMNGVEDGTPDNDDYTTPSLGTAFALGSNVTATSQLNGIIQSVAIFSDAKTSDQVAAITAILN